MPTDRDARVDALVAEALEYEARDTRLGRTVAIKILPPGAASDPERRRRFEHEARAVAALKHPHICPLHDIGEAEPTYPACPERAGERASRRESRREPVRVSFLVLEHLDGQTLAARLARGPLPLAQVLEMGAQIADALGAAHKAGIVWTLPYMAPEQVEGREADARDIADELRWIAHHAIALTAITDMPRGRRAAWTAALHVGAAALAAGSAALTWIAVRDPNAREAVRYAVELPPGRRVVSLALSSNGTVIIQAVENGRSVLYRCQPHNQDEELIPGTEGATAPMVSPDGEWVAFFKEGGLFKTRLDTTVPAPTCLLRSDSGPTPPRHTGDDPPEAGYDAAALRRRWPPHVRFGPGPPSRGSRAMVRRGQPACRHMESGFETGRLLLGPRRCREPLGGPRRQAHRGQAAGPFSTPSGSGRVVPRRQVDRVHRAECGLQLGCLGLRLSGPEGGAHQAKPPFPTRIEVVLGWLEEFKRRTNRLTGRAALPADDDAITVYFS